MADYTELKAAIRAAIFDNTEQAITGETLQEILIEMVDELGESYVLPEGGIPASDLAQAVRDALAEAVSAYQLPVGGIPEADLAQAVRNALAAGLSAYQKPASGIPETDLAQAVRDALAAALSAYQKPQGGIPKADLSQGVQGSLNKADGALTQSDIADNLTTDDPTKILSAKQGKVLAGQVSQLGQKVDGLFSEYAERRTYSISNFVSGYTNTNSLDIGSSFTPVSSTTPMGSSSSAGQCLFPVKKGDRLTVKMKSTSSQYVMAYVFLDNDKKILSWAGKTAQVVNWLNDPHVFAVAQDGFAVFQIQQTDYDQNVSAPLTIYADRFVEIFDLREDVIDIQEEISGDESRVITETLAKDGWVTHLFDKPIEVGSKIIKIGLKSSSNYELASCYLVKDDGTYSLNVNTLVGSLPYTTTEKYIGYKANVAGSLMLFFDGSLGITTARREIHILRTDTIETVVKKMWMAFLYSDTDVIFEKSTYTIDDNAIDYIVANFSILGRIGLPLGKGCRYYLNGSTIVVSQTERYSGNKQVSCFDNQSAASFGWEIYDGILINNNSKYCVHDETEGVTTPYLNKLKNVRMYAQNNAQAAYGCGIGYDSHILFDNCLFCGDGSSISSSNMVFHSPTNPNSAIHFDLTFNGCYFDANTTISVGTAGFDITRDTLVLVCANSSYTNEIPSYVLDIFNKKYIY